MDTKIVEKPDFISREEKNGITPKLLHEYFDYKEGFLIYKVRQSQRNKIGDKVETIITDEYKSRYVVTIDYKKYYVSRLIFCWHHGYFPQFVDHIDHDTLNNNINNLRAATRSQNNCNITLRKGSSSQYIGVSYVKEQNKWGVEVKFQNKRVHLGYFESEIEAALARNREAVKLHGEFANLNIIQPKK